MLHGGTSLEAFKAWAGSERNLVILPGYQVWRGGVQPSGFRVGLRVYLHERAAMILIRCCDGHGRCQGHINVTMELAPLPNACNFSNLHFASNI